MKKIAIFASGSGTNAESYHISGIPTGLISIPLRYMHTTVETVHSEDVQNVVNLLYKFVINLKDKHDFRYDLS